MNTQEMLNREIKASKMARACFDAGITVDELAAGDASDWQLLANAAGCQPPHSKDTVDRVLALLEQAYAEQAAEGKWEEQQMQESGADRCPPRE